LNTNTFFTFGQVNEKIVIMIVKKLINITVIENDFVVKALYTDFFKRFINIEMVNIQ